MQLADVRLADRDVYQPLLHKPSETGPSMRLSGWPLTWRCAYIGFSLLLFLIWRHVREA